MLVTTDFFDDLMIRTFRFDHETLQQRRDEALVNAAKHLITALENASQRADALAYELQDYVQRIEEKNKPEPKAKRKVKAKK
jgi:dsDNA-specific endonuclease/ATPase MutS2